jgi:hypothetical protein
VDESPLFGFAGVPGPIPPSLLPVVLVVDMVVLVFDVDESVVPPVPEPADDPHPVAIARSRAVAAMAERFTWTPGVQGGTAGSTPMEDYEPPTWL